MGKGKLDQTASDRAKIAQLNRKIKMAAKSGHTNSYHTYVAERQEVLDRMAHKVCEPREVQG